MPPLLLPRPAVDIDNYANRQHSNTSIIGAKMLWDRTRCIDSTWTDVVRAILYELQIVRWSTLVHHASNLGLYGEKSVSAMRLILAELHSLILWGGSSLWQIVKGVSPKDALWVAGLCCYCYVIRVLHRLFLAGPFIIILSGMIIILTIGLDDKKKAGVLSAYSVFNRNCRSMLGSLDAEGLVEQYVAGNMGIVGARARADPGRRGFDDPPAIPQELVQQQQQPQPNKARKSGKKSRRGDLDQRRDRQRQRQIAAEMGFVEDEEVMEQIGIEPFLNDAFADE